MPPGHLVRKVTVVITTPEISQLFNCAGTRLKSHVNCHKTNNLSHCTFINWSEMHHLKTI